MCGADRITYANRCLAECQGVTVAAAGVCTSTPPVAGAAATGAAAGRRGPRFLAPENVDGAATVSLATVTKYAGEGYSYVARVKLQKTPPANYGALPVAVDVKSPAVAAAAAG